MTYSTLSPWTTHLFSGQQAWKLQVPRAWTARSKPVFGDTVRGSLFPHKLLSNKCPALVSYTRNQLCPCNVIYRKATVRFPRGLPLATPLPCQS
jgi:hypothetical protein